MNRFIALGFASILGLASMASGLAPEAARAADIALVIGNHDYKAAPDAVSAEIDAREVAAALEDGGYDVTLGIDMTRREMRNQLSRFAGKIGSADKVVIYYSGHALRSNGITYLAPVDQQNGSLVQVMLDGVPLELVMRLAQRGRRGAVVFIDAAQLDGFVPNANAEPGLATIEPAEGVLVVSAAAPGRALRRRYSYGSEFAADVVREFLSPGARTMDAARGIKAPAWITGAVPPGMRLVTRRGASIGAVGGSAQENPAAVEDALELSPAQRRDIQESLSLLGHDPRGIDGAFGPGTRTAIRLWQRANNMTETGYLTGEQIALLQSQSRSGGSPGVSDDTRDETLWARTGASRTADGYRAYLERSSDGPRADDARDGLKRIARAGTDIAARRELEDWRFAEANDRPRDYRDYLERYPTGIWQPEAQARLSGLAGSPAPASADPVAEETALALTRNDRLSIEQRLNYLGFSPGTQDGFFDANARRAIEGYQRSRDFRPTGYMDHPTIARLLDETAGVTQGIIIDGATVLRNLLGGGN
jgi:peptidoglycan hydrolase-like protein with peptidoglycan-binding domain